MDDSKCEQCDKGRLIVRHGPYGAFLGCDQFPRCKATKPYGEKNDEMTRIMAWYGAREEDFGDQDYDIDPDQEDVEVEQRLRAYEKWLDRT